MKLYNTLRRELNKKYGKNNVKKIGFSMPMIRDLLNKYIVFESCITRYDKYENYSIWQDIEGEGSGWLFLNRTKDDAHFRLMTYILDILKENKKYLYKRNIFYIEMENFIMIIFPLRDVRNYDFSISFNKTKFVPNGWEIYPKKFG